MPFLPLSRQNESVHLGATIGAANWRRLVRGALGSVVCFAISAALVAQPGPAQQESNNALGPPTTVHGVVMNAATGEPLPRVLVQINGGSGQSVLTDGDGRFEVAGVSLGPCVFQLTRPGFEDMPSSDGSLPLRDLRGYTRNVFVTASTPELTFTMRPTNSIRGHMELSTGDIAQNIGVTLLERQIQLGRASWRPAASTRTNADGNFHFGHLGDGDYIVKADPAPEAELPGQPIADPRNLHWNGYPEIYHPDAHDFSGAAQLHLSGGQQSEANITMPLEAFHALTAAVVLPPDLRNSSTGNVVTPELVGSSGMQVPYTVTMDGYKLTALVPDGSYSIRVTASHPDRAMGPGGASTVHLEATRTGQVDFTVAGHPVNTRIPVGPMAASPLQVVVNRTGRSTASNVPGSHGEVFVEISQAATLTDGMQTEFAKGSGPGALETSPPAPGKYWVHTVIADSALCEDSFTAGGASLGREPLVVGQSGATAPLTLTLRDDCASLKVSLPNNSAAMTAGEERGYVVYLVPDFDTTAEADSTDLRPSTTTSRTFVALRPGGYHVYTFAAPVNLEYRNRDVLAGLHGQAITLAPGDSAELTVEVPEQ
jgi:hypothetical protein